MAQALIRNLDDDLLEDYRESARRNGRPLEAELREALQRAKPITPRRQKELIELSREIRARTANPSGSVEGWRLIREDRDSR